MIYGTFLLAIRVARSYSCARKYQQLNTEQKREFSNTKFEIGKSLPTFPLNAPVIINHHAFALMKTEAFS